MTTQPQFAEAVFGHGERWSGKRNWTVPALSDQDIQALANHTYSPKTARRFRIVLLASAGWTNSDIADHVEVSAATVARWKQRFAAEGIAGLIGGATTKRSATGRRVEHGAASIVRASLAASRSSGPGPITARRIAEQTSLSMATVVRAWRRYGITPHPTGGWLFNLQPNLIAASMDLVGAYLAPQARVATLVVGPGAAASRRQMRAPGPNAVASRAAAATPGTIHSLPADEPVAQQLADFLQQIQSCSVQPIHVVTDSPAVLRWLRSHERVKAHLAADAPGWFHLMDVCGWMQAACPTAAQQPLGDTLRGLNTTGRRFRLRTTSGRVPIESVNAATSPASDHPCH